MHRRTFLRHSSVALAASTFTACSSKAKPQLHVFTWSDYLDPTLQQKFENLHKCTVVIDTYDSNEAMFAKLKGGATGYDIVVPSSYMVKAMIRENLLAKLDLTKIPNTKNIDADHLENCRRDEKRKPPCGRQVGPRAEAWPSSPAQTEFANPRR